MVTGVRDEGASQHHGQIMDPSLGGLLSEGFDNFGVGMGSLTGKGTAGTSALCHLQILGGKGSTAQDLGLYGLGLSL